ncbi:hypothetical protein NIES22_46760 [Calothrix brevissima NIES-22]|nr:hypothetical protein NIES22_46760 [Calothrix brevissima NIES-22]
MAMPCPLECNDVPQTVLKWVLIKQPENDQC